MAQLHRRCSIAPSAGSGGDLDHHGLLEVLDLDLDHRGLLGDLDNRGRLLDHRGLDPPHASTGHKAVQRVLALQGEMRSHGSQGTG